MWLSSTQVVSMLFFYKVYFSVIWLIYYKKFRKHKNVKKGSSHLQCLLSEIPVDTHFPFVCIYIDTFIKACYVWRGTWFCEQNKQTKTYWKLVSERPKFNHWLSVWAGGKPVIPCLSFFICKMRLLSTYSCWRRDEAEEMKLLDWERAHNMHLIS